ncbi:related to ZRT2 - Zinc transporter II [Melanopsichium pennsylvanicum]|uniref:Related to ZRT2 - Zinc transporter II n=2 Tax=Melanopsichium pennsylvanicum TaxID=63383 RepID=A0AAJ4XSN0_9BASI|nr:related to ZRT2-Zinc transporter II [Melanopsichium pennsylvanicum 4]SNX87156.1 related to ZRT2 - Zinc transporter II [Melanopsichium pennsylvanicum]
MFRFAKSTKTAVTLLFAATAAAQSITTVIIANGSPTTTVVAPSPTGRGFCEFYIDHWDCNSTRQETSPSAATAATASSSASSIDPSPIGQNCHLHGDNWDCDGPATSTGTAASASASPVGRGACQLHDDHWDCEQGAEEDEHDHSKHSDSHSEDSHTGHSDSESADAHAGHNHGPSAEFGCGLVPLENYDMALHVGAVFILFAGSAVGTYLPITVFSAGKKWGGWADEIFFICRHFGTGVIVSTAFVHLLSHAMLYWANECIGDLQYEATGPSIAMSAVWMVFLVDFFLLRALRKRSGAGDLGSEPISNNQHADENVIGKRESNSTLDRTALPNFDVDQYAGLTYAQAKVAEWDVIAIEAGMIFHSVLIGVTLGVTTGSGFVALLISITFHQLFEGLALGSRLSLLTWKSTAYKLAMGTGFVLTTPIGIAIGIGVRKQFNGNSAGTLITQGTLLALSAGILLYTALVELLSGDFIHNKQMQRNSLGRCIAAVTALTIGVIAMSVLALWA